jgi:PIN domain nuclease of toxin-antitoxin system
MSTAIIDERQEIEEMLDTLSEEHLSEVLNFLRYLLFKQTQIASGPYQVVDNFEGLWADYEISEADIAAARQELWANFGNKDISLIWYLAQPRKLSGAIRQVFQEADQGQAQILVPSIVLIEVIYIGDRQRIPASLVNRLFKIEDEAAGAAYQIVPLSKAVAVTARDFGPAVIPEMADRIIAATARHLDLPLLSSDAAIIDSGLVKIYS